MRVISGTKRGTKLYGPNENKIRPTTDRSKESLFNIINQRIYNSNFLDLFAGTGAIGLEAKSRGAKLVICVDKLQESINLIKENVNKTKLEISVQKRDVESFIKTTSIKFDIIFLDPPYLYTNEYVSEIVNLIFQNELLKENGMIIIEREYRKENEDLFSKYDFVDIRKYGKVSFIFIK